jgi:hypothetical protein
MAFSLRRLVKHVGDDLNPFDGPAQPAQTAVAPPPPASTARPQARPQQPVQSPLSVQPVQRPALTVMPQVQQPKINPTVQVAKPQPLQVGDTTVAPDPNARTGVAPAPPKASFIDKAKAFDTAATSSAFKTIGQVAETPDLLRVLTPNFIPGVSSHIDPAIHAVAEEANKPFHAVSNFADNVANENDLYNSPQTEAARRFGNVAGTGLGVVATGGVGAAGDALRAAKAAPAVIKALPEIAPKALDAGRQVVAHTTGLVDPKFAGLAKNQVIMDTQKLDVLKNALNPPADVPGQQELINGLHQIKNDHGLDFITGSPADRKMRINQFLEQNGEAIPELQKWMDRPTLAGNEIGAVGRNVRNDGSDPMTPIGDVLANKQKQLESKAPVATTKLVPQKAELPAPGDIPTTNAGKVKRTRFTDKTVQNSDQVSAEVKAKTDASYTSDTMKGALARAKDSVDQNGIKSTLESTLKELNGKRGTASRDAQAHAIELASRLDATGKEADATMAAKLLNLAGEHGSAHGQASQILSAIARRSPAGLRNKAINDLKLAGKDVLENNTKKIGDLSKQLKKLQPGTKEHDAITKQLQDLADRDSSNKAIRDEIQGHIDTIAGMEDGPAKDFQIAVLQKAVAKHLPQSKGDQALSLWKAGLLSGVRTHGGNIISNAAFGGLKKISDVPAAAADKALSVVTGQRTKTATGRGITTGTGAGLKTAKKTLQTGIDTRSVGDKYEQHAELNLGNPILQKTLGNAANGVFRLLSSADQPTYYAALKNSMYDQAKADGLNQGLRGSGLRQHMNELVKNPTEQMAATAEKEANKSVLSYDTFGSKAVAGIHRGIDNLPESTDAGKAIAHAAVNVLAPFVRVPSAFISRTTDFTPLGIPKEVFHQVAGKQFDQRALAQATGESATGTGLIALGIALTQNKLLSGDYPKNNPKEQARWKAEGITPNSVKVGNKWISLNYMGPLGLLFNAGNKIENATGESAGTKIGAALGGLGQGLLGQSFLQGFSGFSDAIQDPERNAKSFINSEASSLVPSLSNDFANATDKFQRNANTPFESAKNRIPGARETNSVKTDVYGNDLKRPSSPLDTFNPLRPSNNLSNPVISEVNRLHNVDPKNSDLQVTPTPVQRQITVDKNTVTLNNKQREDLQKQIGQATQANWDRLIKMPEYQKLDDAGKANSLNSLRTATTEDAQRQYVVDNNLGTYSKAASKAGIRAASSNLSSFAKAKGATAGNFTEINEKTDPHSAKVLSQYDSLSADDRKKKAYGENSYDYKVAQAKYDNDLANGSLSQAQKITRMDKLKKAKVGSAYSKDTRELFELSKGDLADLVENDPDGNAKAKQVIAYDQALTDVGVQAKNKYKNGIIPSSASVGSGGSGGSGKAALSAFITRSKAISDLGTKNQGDLQSLIKNAQVSSKGSNNKQASIVRVTLKKQSAKKQKAKVA